jgi:hypothetical protein
MGRAPGVAALGGPALLGGLELAEVLERLPSSFFILCSISSVSVAACRARRARRPPEVVAVLSKSFSLFRTQTYTSTSPAMNTTPPTSHSHR